MNIVAIDLETTGLPLRKRAPISDNKNWPYIVQASWIVMKNNKIEKVCDYIIQLPIGKTIPVIPPPLPSAAI